MSHEEKERERERETASYLKKKQCVILKERNEGYERKRKKNIVSERRVKSAF